MVEEVKEEIKNPNLQEQEKESSVKSEETDAVDSVTELMEKQKAERNEETEAESKENSVQSEENEKNKEEPPDTDDNSGEGDIDSDEGQSEEDASAESELDESLVNKAKELGFSESELEGFDNGQVEKLCTAAERKLIEGREESEPKKDEQDSAEPDEGKKGESDEDNDDDLFVPEIEGDWDEEFKSNIQSAMREMSEHYSEQVESLVERNDALYDVIMEQRLQEFHSKFDGFINNLGWKDVFGEGTGFDLDAKSAEMQNRNKVLDQMDVLANAYSSSGKNIPNEKELFESALKLEFGDKYYSQGSKKQKKRSGISRPSKRKGKPIEKGDDAAISAVKEILDNK